MWNDIGEHNANGLIIQYMPANQHFKERVQKVKPYLLGIFPFRNDSVIFFQIIPLLRRGPPEPARLLYFRECQDTPVFRKASAFTKTRGQLHTFPSCLRKKSRERPRERLTHCGFPGNF